MYGEESTPRDTWLCEASINSSNPSQPLSAGPRLEEWLNKTIRHLATRVNLKEHGTSSSAVFNHLSSCKTCKSNCSCNSFSIKSEPGVRCWWNALKQLHKWWRCRGTSLLLFQAVDVVMNGGAWDNFETWTVYPKKNQTNKKTCMNNQDRWMYIVISL